MRVVGLDLGTQCGYAWTMTPQVVARFSGTWDLRPQRFEGGGMRYLRFRDHLDELARYEDPSAIYFEEVRAHRGTDAAHIYGGLLGVLSAWCEQREVPYLGIPVGTIKRRATGKGNANKARMIAAANAEWPGHEFTKQDENRVDALWVLRCGLDKRSGEVAA